jgi:hypothetical protein
MEFSKKLLIFSWIITSILTTLYIWLSLNEFPTDAFMVITPLSWTETGAATGFYYWKARNENRAKFAQKFLRDLAEEYGVDNALRVSEIVLKD